MNAARATTASVSTTQCQSFMPHLYAKAHSGQCTRSGIDGEQVALLHAVKSVRWAETGVTGFELRDVNLHGARRIFVRRFVPMNMIRTRASTRISRFLGTPKGVKNLLMPRAGGMSTRAIAEVQGSSGTTVRRAFMSHPEF
jgi:hypothetical protein